jgi:hypothetical protein
LIRRTARLTVLAWLACLAAGCSHDSTTPAPPSAPDPNAQVTPTSDASGPIRISFLSANLAPGSTVTGCGSAIKGCEGRLRITLQLQPASSGPVLYTRVFLHSQRNLVACLWGETGAFSVQAGQTQTVEVTLDRSDACGTPETIASMDAIVEGPIQVASRQAWVLHYVFAP